MSLVLGDIEFAEKLVYSANKIHLLSGRLIQVDEAVKAKVKNIYEDLPAHILGDKKLKGRLYEAAALMFWNENNKQIKESCKYMVVQLEMICEYIIIKYDVFSWAVKQNEIYKKESKNEYPLYSMDFDYKLKLPKYLKTKSKIQATCDYLIKEKGLPFFDSSKVIDVIEVRNYVSHGYHQNEISKKQSIINRVSNGFEEYSKMWIDLLMSIKKFLRDE